MSNKKEEIKERHIKVSGASFFADDHTAITEEYILKAKIQMLEELYEEKFEAWDEDVFEAIEATSVKRSIEKLKNKLEELK